MKWMAGVLVCVAAAGCSGVRTLGDADSAPFKAMVVFQWADRSAVAAAAEVPLARGAGGGGEGAPQEALLAGRVPSPEDAPVEAARAEVENAILDGLEGQRVFSRLVRNDGTSMQAVAGKERPDLLVLIDIESFCEWREEKMSVVKGRAALGTALWLATGIGGWVIPDREFPTKSNIEVSWGRPDPPGAPPRQDPRTLRNEFQGHELLSTGEYRLSLWERARPWRFPWPYLLSIVVPPAFMPLQDDRQVDSSLRESALEDLNRELARKLKGGYIHAAGAPFLFHLDSPANWKELDSDEVSLIFRYTPEAGFREEGAIGLGSLTIVLEPPAGEPRTIVEYRPETIRPLNEKIYGHLPLEEIVRGLKPGVNLIRFVAVTERDQKWIRNTVAIRRR